MKITQEVRDFAAKQAAAVSSPELSGEGNHLQGGGGAVSEAEAREGMAAMTKRFHEEGGELYVPARQ
jgi:hypothetical protein